MSCVAYIVSISLQKNHSFVVCSRAAGPRIREEPPRRFRRREEQQRAVDSDPAEFRSDHRTARPFPRPSSLVPRPSSATSPSPSPASLLETIVRDTTADQEIVDITDRVREIVRRAPAQSRIVTVTSQHTTCAVWVNENEHFLRSDICRRFGGNSVPCGVRAGVGVGGTSGGRLIVAHLF